MARVKVYRFKVYNPHNGEMEEAQRLARLDVIDASQQLVLIPGGALEVDESLLDGNGMTRLPQRQDGE